MNVFSYDPLPTQAPRDAVRLIELLPDDNASEIRCNLQAVSLSNSIQYEAISYCWGDPANTTPIFVNGKKLEITVNLYSALQRFRFSDKKRYLWADAICIDQLNFKERNHQVQLMRDIYKKSSQTLVWLGEESEKMRTGFTVIERLQIAQREGLCQNKWLVAPLLSSGLPQFLSIFDHPYFSRVWIVQEVAVSPVTIVCCGTQTISWNNLVAAILFCSRIGLLVGFDRRNLNRFLDIEKTRYWTTAGVDQGLLQLLLGFRSFNATDSKDKVYGLMGLSRTVGTVAVEIKPDYNQAVSAQNTYLSAAISILRASQSLDIFSVPRPSEQSTMLGLPSWVPDWSVPETALSLLLPGLRGEELEEWPQYRATGASISVIQPKFQPNGLTVQLCGHFIDSVHKIGELLGGDDVASLPSEFMARGYRMLLDIFWEMCKNRLLLINWETITGARSGGEYVTGEDMLDAYWQTLLGGYRTRNTQGRLRSLQEERKTWEDNLTVYRFPCYLHLHHWNFTYAVATIVFEGLNIFWNILIFLLSLIGLWKFDTQGPGLDFSGAVMSKNRRMFKTRDGYIGLGPSGMEEGDRIALFKGGKMPLVVRPVGEDLELVGDCYVHGIMFGERFHEEECELIWFV